MFFHGEEVKCLDRGNFYFYFMQTTDLLLKGAPFSSESSIAAFTTSFFFFSIQQAYNVVGAEFQTSLINALKGKGTIQ